MNDDIITEDDFREYMRARVRNIAAKRGERPGMLSQEQARTEFACDLFGAVMYRMQTDDDSIYERIGIPDTLVQQAESAVRNALAYDPEVEHDLDDTLAENDAACGNEDAVEFSEGDPFNGRSQVILDIDMNSHDLERNKVDVSRMGSVADLTGFEFPKNGESLIERVTAYFDSFGNVVNNPAIGEILATVSSFHDDMGHGYGNAKIVTFAAIPQVLQTGKLVAYSKNWMGRNYDTAVLAAPITIGGKEYFMGIRVMRNTQSQRYEIHEVMAVDIEKPSKAFTSRPSTDGEVSRASDDSSLNSILNQIAEYKRNFVNFPSQSAADTAYMSAVDAYLADKSEANLAKVQQMVDAAAHIIHPSNGVPYVNTKSYRGYGRKTPMSRSGYAMFVDDANAAYFFGDDAKQQMYAVDHTKLVDVGALVPRIETALHDAVEYDMLPYALEYLNEHDLSKVAREFDPNNIVDSAGAWDNEDMVSWLFETGIMDGIIGVKTSDGAVVFDDGAIDRIDGNADVIGIDPSDVTDPITYDDNGNVIPLSQRFDVGKQDVRWSENPLTESPEIREALDKARTLFENGVHYLAYYNQDGADNGVAKFLRGMWDSANKTDALKRAVALYRAGKSVTDYYNDSPEDFNYQVARQLQGIQIRNGQAIGGRLGNEDMDAILRLSDGFTETTAKKLLTKTAPRVFEDLAGNGKGDTPEEIARSILEGNTVKDVYYGFGNRQQGLRTKYQEDILPGGEKGKTSRVLYFLIDNGRVLWFNTLCEFSESKLKV